MSQSQMHQIELVLQPDLILVEQIGKVVTIEYRSGEKWTITFTTAAKAAEFFNDTDFHYAEDAHLITGGVASISVERGKVI